MSNTPHNMKEKIESLSHSLLTLGTGPLAELRRMPIDDVGTRYFWALAAKHKLFPKGDFPEKQHLITKWMLIVKIMALLSPKGEKDKSVRLHDEYRPLGEVLCDGGDRNWHPKNDSKNAFLSEPRLARFLAQTHDQRCVSLERLARSLATNRNIHHGINCCDIAYLILFEDSTQSLRKLAETYYRRLDNASRLSNEEETE